MTKSECEWELANTIEKKNKTMLELQDFLSSNTGRCSTKDSNETVMWFAELLNTLGYNEAHCTRLLKEEANKTCNNNQ